MLWTDVRSAGMTALRRVRSLVGGAVVILTYHRISDDETGPGENAVSPDRFAEHVSAFAERYELVTAGDVMRRLGERVALPRRGLCITLDDGYADLLSTALPVLAEHGAPATAFVCSGYVDQPREFWWDELERLILVAGELPGRLALAAGTAHLDLEPPVDVRSASPEAAARRRRLHADLADFLEPLPSADREAVLGQLREQTGQTRVIRPEKRPLTANELRRLAGSGLVEIGAHTVNHVRLGSLPVSEQRDEIEGSKRRLQELVERPVESFSYPYGTPGSISPDTERLVREAGFAGAVTTQLGTFLPWGSVSRGSDRLALPRTATANVAAEDLVALIDKRLGL